MFAAGAKTRRMLRVVAMQLCGRWREFPGVAQLYVKEMLFLAQDGVTPGFKQDMVRPFRGGSALLRPRFRCETGLPNQKRQPPPLYAVKGLGRSLRRGRAVREDAVHWHARL